MTTFNSELQQIYKIAGKYKKYDKTKYWISLISTAIFGWGSFYALLSSETVFLKLLFFTLSTIFLYKGTVFTHELVHLDEKQLPGFRSAWTILFGIPLLAPHFLYRELHLAHHSKNKYNTEKDIEYSIFWGDKNQMITYYFKNLAIPFMSTWRFSVLPLTIFLGGNIRKMIRLKASSMGIKFIFTREEVKNSKEKKRWLAEELSCFLYCWGIIYLIATTSLTPSLWITWAAVLFGVLTLNTYRFLSATHLYQHTGEEIDFETHVLDSVNIKQRGIIAHIIAPIGQTCHGLHHIVPFVPGLELESLHQELIRSLEEKHFYHKINYRDFSTVYRQIMNGKKDQIDERKEDLSIQAG